MRYFQHGFNYSQDGAGNRLVYHLQGCNMTCPWCSNPEGMDINGKAQEKTTDEIVKEIISCSPMFFDGGGVTFTGGEASLQLPAVYEIMQRVKQSGISTAIETNATHKEITKLLEVCDIWMVDFKHPNAEKLKAVAGASLEAILKNLLELSLKAHLHIRIPLIHGFNDSTEELQGFITTLSKIREKGGSFDIEILAYHEYGKEKWAKCQKEYTVTNGFVSNETVNIFTTALQNNGFTVIHT